MDCFGGSFQADLRLELEFIYFHSRFNDQKTYSMKLRGPLFCLVLLLCGTLSAQELINPIFSFSQKKDAYITMKDGKELVGRITGAKRSKGLLEEIKYKGADGKKTKINPADIQYMYVQPTAADKFGNAVSKMNNIQRWGEEDVDHELLKEGYSYFEQAEVMVKKKKKVLLMQLLNPHFGAKVKVYHDPFANSTASVGVGGFTVAGGDEKSYYVQFGEDTAFKLEKKHYRSKFEALYKSCPDVVKKYGGEIMWGALVEHIIAYTECSGS